MSTAAPLATAALGALAGAVTPRLAYRLSVDHGVPPRPACGECAAPFPGGPRGWIRPGDRCPSCRARTGPYAWLTAPTGALVCGVLGWVVDPAVRPAAAPSGWNTAAGVLVLAAFLLAGAAGVLLGAIDLRCLRLPDTLVRPTSVLVLALLGASAVVSGSADDLVRALVAALLLAGVYLVLAGLPGAGLGPGDVKLCIPLGLLLGWLGWGAVLLGGALPHLINGPVALALLLTRRVGRKAPLPLGPALLAGTLLALVAYTVTRR